MPTTLVEGLEQVTADSAATVTVVDSSGPVDSTTWADLLEGSIVRAGALQARGLGPGDRVALLGFTSREMLESIFAVSLCGATIVVMPLPMRLSSREAFIDLTRRRLVAADAQLLLVDDFFEAQYEPAASDPAVVHFRELIDNAVPYAAVPVGAGDLAVLQFTSGSTADPRAVCLPHRSICNNIWSMNDAIDRQKNETVMSWLPLYHDMGLIGTLFVPALTGMSLVTAPPQAFLSRPRMWMECVSAHRATITCAPNFGYALATKGLGRSQDLDLSSLRAALCGAEPVSASTMEQFVAAGHVHGLRPTAPVPVYGLAEATLAVTFANVHDEIRVDVVDRKTLEDGEHAIVSRGRDVKQLVGLGRPLRGISLRIIDEDEEPLPERCVGEVLVASDAAMDGYDKHHEETARILRHGWLHTGDLGYVSDGDLFICGRNKDLIIVAGRNIWPEDVEEAAQLVPGVRAGNAIAFGVDRSGAREALVLIAETKQDATDALATASAVTTAVKERIGLAPRQVILLEPGSLPKTSSGKLQRGLCRQRYLAGDMEPVAAHGSAL